MPKDNSVPTEELHVYIHCNGMFALQMLKMEKADKQKLKIV